MLCSTEYSVIPGSALNHMMAHLELTQEKKRRQHHSPLSSRRLCCRPEPMKAVLILPFPIVDCIICHMPFAVYRPSPALHDMKHC